MKKFLILTVFVFFQFICIGKINGVISPIFDVSPDGNKLAISITNENGSSIYELSLITNELEQLTKANNELHHRPVYSPNGESIMYLVNKTDQTNNDLYEIDLNSKNQSKLTTGEMYITEAIYSSSGSTIYFCGAGYYGSYSPVGRKAPHDLDIFSMTLDTKEQKKLTKLSAYGLSSISLSENDSYILCSISEKEYSGFYHVSLSDTTISDKIEAQNNPREAIGSSFYNTPIYSSDFKQIAFTAPYQLYIMNMDNKLCEEVWSTFGKEKQAMPMLSKYINGNNSLIFSILKIENRQYSNNAEFIIVDLKSKKTKPVVIN